MLILDIFFFFFFEVGLSVKRSKFLLQGRLEHLNLETFNLQSSAFTTGPQLPLEKKDLQNVVVRCEKAMDIQYKS